MVDISGANVWHDVISYPDFGTTDWHIPLKTSLDGVADRTVFLHSSVTELSGGMMPDYSTSEVDTGRKWIDGKTVYSKIIEVGALSLGKTYPHGITGLDSVVKISCIGDNGSGAYLHIPFHGTGSDGISIYVASSNIEFPMQVDRSSYDGTVIIEYTKV